MSHFCIYLLINERIVPKQYKDPGMFMACKLNPPTQSQVRSPAGAEPLQMRVAQEGKQSGIQTSDKCFHLISPFQPARSGSSQGESHHGLGTAFVPLPLYNPGQGAKRPPKSWQWAATEQDLQAGRVLPCMHIHKGSCTLGGGHIGQHFRQQNNKNDVVTERYASPALLY